MLIYVVCLSFFGVSRFSSKDLWFGWCAVHRRQLNQQNLDRRRLCGILVSKHISHCDPLRTLTDEIPKPTTPTNINALHLTASDCIWLHLTSVKSVKSVKFGVFGVWPGKMASRKDLASSVDLGEASWRSSNRTPSSGGHPPQHPSKTSRHLQTGCRIVFRERVMNLTWQLYVVVLLKVVDCITAFAIRSCLWKLLFDVHYTLFDTVLFVFFNICHTWLYMLHTFPSLLLCFLCWLCCQLQILRPHLLPIVRNKWICICSRKHLAGFRQRQLPLSTSCILLSFLAILASVPNNFDYIKYIIHVYPSIYLAQTSDFLFVFFKQSWDEISSRHTGGTCRTLSLAPEVLLGFIPSHTFSHHQVHARMILVKSCEAWWRCSAASRLSVSFLVISTGSTSEAYFA